MSAEKTAYDCFHATNNLEICIQISTFPDLSLRLNKVECTQYLISDVAPFHGGVSTVVQRVAKDKVISYSAAALPLSN